MKTIAFACCNKDDDIRMKSSSGGVFFELAQKVISEGGTVFGAKYDENRNVVHSHADTMKGVMDFLGSKYVQSSIGEEYKLAKECLESGRKVLFSGTPCQIGGLRAYLKKDYENLITVDFICHGVPSRKVWREYVKEISQNKRIENISFRDKTEGWYDFSLKIDFSDGSSYRKNNHNDVYIKGFLSDLYLRPSCYDCKFKGTERKSDITIADYWGVQNDLPDMYDNKGTSLVLVHSKSGMKIWNDIQNRFTVKETDVNTAISHNPNYTKSVSMNLRRKSFFAQEKYDTPTIAYFSKKTLIQRIIRKTKYIIKIINEKK